MDYRKIILDSGIDIRAVSINCYTKGDPIKKYKLMLKQHVETGLSYICITKNKNYEKYTGSGIRWKRLLESIPSKISTLLVYTTDDREELAFAASLISLMFNIPNNPNFCNLVAECGYEGNQGNLAEWVKNATSDELKVINEKRRKSIKENIEQKKQNGIPTPIEVATSRLKEETGLSNFMQIADVVNRVRSSQKSTLIEKYGVEHNMQIPGIGVKVAKSRKETLLKMYGVEHIMQVPEICESANKKAIATIQKRYGVTNISQVPGWKEKVGSSISSTKLSVPKLKCEYCDFSSRTIHNHTPYCKHNPNRISKPTEECVHCGKIASKANITRFHNNNCKKKDL